MRRTPLATVLAAALVIALPASALAGHAARPHTDNMQARGHSVHVATFLGEPDGIRHISSDIAFQGDLAFHGNYDGFRIIDISDADNPTEIVHARCNGDQGDIVVWKNILVRSWNSKKTVDRTCDGQTVPAGWEGVHVFDISNLTDPDLVASVSLPCGSHTVTLAPDEGNDRLIVYSNNSSSAGCIPGAPQAVQDPVGDFIDVVEVPIENPEDSFLLRREPLQGPVTGVATGCHDMGIILGDVNLAACASADATNVYDIGENNLPGGSLADPKFLYTIVEPGVGQLGTNGRWHSATFSWDGKVIILGWEPGGGAAPECETSDPAVDKSAFFYDAATGAKLGQWTLPRGQDGAVVGGVKIDENCTIHNYNVVPVEDRYILVSGNYQAGTWVTDFTNPASPVTLGFSDPPVLVRQTPTGPAAELGGSWSSYWYNNFLYESSITEGLKVFSFTGAATRDWQHLDRLNPLTQEFSFG